MIALTGLSPPVRARYKAMSAVLTWCSSSARFSRRLIRCLGSDRIRLISGADDARIVVWDKNSGHLLVDFNDHEDKVG